ncbi:MAG: DUF4982 domain-containing protein [Bacteroidales bacterium]|nr:DUF4982 domain-containing protein [Bacteroidales bacterium]
MKHLFALLSLLFFVFSEAIADSEKYNFNPDWLLETTDVPDAQDPTLNDQRWKRVTLPHAWNEDDAFRVLIDSLPTGMVWYRKHFTISNRSGKRYLLEVEGCRQGGQFFLNGKEVGLHENGITAFGLDLTPYLKDGENVLAVRLNNAWDYRETSTNAKFQWNDHNFNANYGGLPKNMWLHIMGSVYQTLPLYRNLGTIGVYVYAKDIDVAKREATIHAESEVRNDRNHPVKISYRVTLTDRDGKQLQQWSAVPQEVPAQSSAKLCAETTVGNLHFWSWGYGYLYDVKTELIVDGKSVDEVVTRTGFRKTQFGEGKIWLNDRVMMVHGYAQRTSNEWPALGIDVPAWLSDYSNHLMVESGGNVVRWMHTCPSKQDVESCDRVGLIQAMPAGDAEKDREGIQWQQRMEAMRDAIIYNRNNPSILFYECGNAGISREHMLQMIDIRNQYDPNGGRAIGCREMLAIDEAEYGGEMLYINKSKKHPMWAMEYHRDEGLRIYWDEDSYPFHTEGNGPLYRGKPALEYNHNQDVFAATMVQRWFDYWRERPGTGKRVSGGGVKIVFSDTNTHCRGEENYRRSGVTDAMRIPKDAFYVHQVMWDGWVSPEKDRTYIIGHWNFGNQYYNAKGELLGQAATGPVERDVQVVSTADKVRLFLNGEEVEAKAERNYQWLFTFRNIRFQAGKLEAIGYNADGQETSRYQLETAGKPAALKLTAIQNPLGFKADGSDVALVQVEVVDNKGRRCPLDNRLVHFTLSGEGEYRGGIARGYMDHSGHFVKRNDNYILCDTLPVECGVNRILVRSTTTPGKITLKAEAEGLKPQKLTLSTQAVETRGGLSSYQPGRELKGWLTRGETPATPSYQDIYQTVDIASASAISNPDQVEATFDDNEYSSWANDGQLSTGRIDFTLVREAAIKDIAVKLGDWRTRRYQLEVFADNQKVWEGITPAGLGYVHLDIKHPVKALTYSIRLAGAAADIDLSNTVGELAGGKTNITEGKKGGKSQLKIVEIDFLEPILAE